MAKFKLTYDSFIKSQTISTSSDNEWQRLVQLVTKNNNDWYSAWQRMTTSDNEWQRMTKRDNRDDEWQWMTECGRTNEKEWGQVK